MSSNLIISVDNQTLYLSGQLSHANLDDIWRQQTTQLMNILQIDVSALTRVDSSGLSLLAYLCIRYKIKLINISHQLKALIELYDLETVVI